MSIKVGFSKSKIYRSKIALVLIALLFVTGAHGDPITKNDVEDLDILISQFIGGEPNVLVIYDNSLSMGDNFGTTQVGNWDGDSVITRCESFQNITSPDGRARAIRAHCIGNAAGVNPCGSTACSGSRTGTCETQEDFEKFLSCIQNTYSESIVEDTFDTVVNDACAGSSDDPITECTADGERAHAAAAMENYALKQANTADSANFPLNCGAAICAANSDDDKSCDTGPGASGVPGDYNQFKTCMTSSRIQPTSTTCANGEGCSQGIYGSTRMDITQMAFFDLLDADDSLCNPDPNSPDPDNPICLKKCDDTTSLFDGVNTSIDCDDFMNTPFRNVGQIAAGTGGGKLPITGASDTALDNELTDEDATILGVRLRAMTYGGSGSSNTSCTNNADFDVAQGGFAGRSRTAIFNVWKHFRGRQAGGRSPLAYALGFDDDSSSSGGIAKEDALNAFLTQLQTDPAIACRPQFVVVLTDGEDTCAGDPALAGSCTTDVNSSCTANPAVTGNANRRSTLQAVSNLRTYYARNPVANRGDSFKKEIFTFVIAMGVTELEAIRTLNAMALAGGTHTTGVIQHTDPDGSVAGTVNIDTLLSGSGNQVYRDFSKALGIDTSPSSAKLQGCSTPNEASGVCSFQGTNVFDNTFFTTFGTFDSTTTGQSFAFFVNTPEELIAAFESINDSIRTFSTSGVSPTAPQSSTSVALRDRIFLSILTPIPGQRIWQGRMALYGFIPDPDNPSARIVVDNTSDRNVIFADDGSLNEFAQNFHWEAGKKLAETDPSIRNLLTVDVDPSLVEIETDAGQVTGVRYIGDRITFNNSLDPSFFGISDADVTDPIPTFCTDGGIGEVLNCSPACSDVTSPACGDCVKECIRDKIVDFMSGNTEITPEEDPLGLPTTGSQTATSMGFDCFDADTNMGGFTTCSVRLGDVFHSTPVVVGSPSPLFFDTGFQTFAKTFRDRTGVVYVGANDGFLHAFNAGDLTNASFANPVTNPFTGQTETVPFFSEGDGLELFAFAPPSFLPDSIAPSSKDPESPSGITPDYRFGDFKSFVVDNSFQRSFFDGTPLIADVWIDSDSTGTNGILDNDNSCGPISSPDGVIDGCGREWHTVLIAGYRNGGGAYTALDVTNVDRVQSDLKKLTDGPDYPKHLWTIFDEDFGNVWSDPTIGRVRMNTSDKQNVDRWVMFVGGGLDPLDIDPTDGVSHGNAFYVIDIVTGQVIFKFHPDGSLTNDDKMVCDMPSKVGAFDLNADGYIDLVYEGDTCGRLWRFDVSMPIETTSAVADTGPGGSAVLTAPDWTGDIAFCANTASQCAQTNNVPTTNIQPIFFAPTVVLDSSGQRHVIFITGNRREPSNSSDYGKLYSFVDGFIPAYLAGGTAISAAMKDEGDFSSGEIIDLVPQSGVTNQFTTSGGTDVQGEFIVNFPDNVGTPSGEKGFGAPVVISGVLVFTTFTPDIDLDENPCSGGTGFGRIFALDYLSGLPALAEIPGAQSLLEGQSDAQKALAAGLTVAEGMPTPAQLTFGARGSVVLTVAFTGSAAAGGSQFLIWELPPFPSRTQTLFWEEIL